MWLFQVFDECMEWLPDIEQIEKYDRNPSESWAIIENPKPVFRGIVKRFGKATPSVHFHK